MRGNRAHIIVLILAVVLAGVARAQTDGPIRVLFYEVQRVEDDSGGGSKLLARIALDNTTRRHVEEWSSTLLWIDGEAGLLLCAVDVSIGVPLSTYRPMEVYLELSSLTDCESGVLADASDRSARLEALDVQRIFVSKDQDTLGRVAEPRIDAIAATAVEEPPAPVMIEHSVPAWVEGDADAGLTLESLVEVHNSTDEVQPAWSGTLQWLAGDPGVVLCTVEVALDEPLHENWPSVFRLELSRVTPCRSGVLTETADVEGRIAALDPTDVWLRSRTHPLDRVRKSFAERQPAEYALTPSVVERVMGNNAAVLECFDQAFRDGYVDCTKVWVGMTVHPDGSITDVEPDTTCLFGWPAFDACLCDAIGSLRYPPFEGTARRVRYPYVVRSRVRRQILSLPEDPVLP